MKMELDNLEGQPVTEYLRENGELLLSLAIAPVVPYWIELRVQMKLPVMYTVQGAYICTDEDTYEELLEEENECSAYTKVWWSVDIQKLKKALSKGQWEKLCEELMYEDKEAVLA